MMRFCRLLPLAASLCFTAAVWGQQLPECAAKCLQSSLGAQSVCAATDTTCICTNGPLNLAIQSCVGQSCTVKETLTTLNVTYTMCERPIRDRTYITTVVASVSGGTALFAVILRTTRALSLAKFGKDDACALVAGLFVIPFNVTQLLIGPAGFGRDVWTVPFSNITFILKMVYLTQIFYWPISALTKMAFLLLYLRIFPRAALHKYIFATMALTCCYWAIFQFGNIFYCKPISMVWEGWDGEHHGHCLNINTFMLTASAANIMIDLIIIVLPIYDLLQLSMSVRRKIGIMAVFAVGGFTLVVSILRVERVTTYAKSQNPTWDNVPADYWSVMEANIAVFCVCMPAIRQAIGYYFPRMFGSTHASQSAEPSNDRKSSKDLNKMSPRRRTFGGSLLYDTNITMVERGGESAVKHDDEDVVELLTMDKQSTQEAKH